MRPLMLINLKRLASCGAFCLWALPLFVSPASAAETMFTDPIQSLEYGVICDYLPQGTEVPAPETNAGKVRRGGVPIHFDMESDIVPARIGTAFGIRMIMAPEAGTRTVTMVTSHPSFGEGYLSQESWPSTITGGRPSTRYFVFEFDYELAPGTWTLDVFLDGDLVVRKAFDVVDPSRIDAIDPCPGSAQIS